MQEPGEGSPAVWRAFLARLPATKLTGEPSRPFPLGPWSHCARLQLGAGAPRQSRVRMSPLGSDSHPGEAAGGVCCWTAGIWEPGPSSPAVSFPWAPRLAHRPSIPYLFLSVPRRLQPGLWVPPAFLPFPCAEGFGYPFAGVGRIVGDGNKIRDRDFVHPQRLCIMKAPGGPEWRQTVQGHRGEGLMSLFVVHTQPLRGASGAPLPAFR